MQNLEKARWAIAAVFFANGAVIGGWAAVIPAVESGLSLGHGAFGLALLAMAVGAIVAMPVAGTMIGRYGSRRVVLVTAAGDLLFILIPVLAPNVIGLALGLLLFGAANGAMDVAMNAHGVGVEGRIGRPIMSSLHGVFSLGGLGGAGLAILMLPHAGAAAFLAALVTGLAVLLAIAARFLLSGTIDKVEGGSPIAWPSGPAVGLGMLAFLALMSEGAVIDWSAIYLRSEQAASASEAAAGFAIFAGAMAASRLTGDHLRLRFGTVHLVRVSAVMSAVGIGAALLAPSVWLSLLGLALAGIGIGNVVPALFGAAGRTPGQSPGVSIATVTTLGYTGFLVGPPLIGRIAEATRLDHGLTVLVAAMMAVAVFAPATRHADDAA